MSIAHSDAAKGILKVLGAPGNWVTRSFLFNAVDYHKKNETTFGQSLHELLQGGLVEENRIKLRPTQYARSGKPMPSITDAPRAQPPKRDVRLRQTPQPEKIERSVSATTARRDTIIECMRAAGMQQFGFEDVRALGLHRTIATTNIYGDMVALTKAGRLVEVEGASPKAWKPAIKLISREASALASATSRAPEAAAAPACAADLHPELQAIELKDWLEMESVLQSATYRAQDAYDSYIAATCDQPTLNALRDSIDKTRTALTMHKARRPA